MSTNLRTFEDKPDAIKEIFVDSVTHSEAVISWYPPDENNSKIQSFRVYVSETDVLSHHNQKNQSSSSQVGMKLVEDVPNDNSFCYKLRGLKPNSAYFVKVIAVNAIGEGYSPKHLSLILTHKESFELEKKLYVWGSNNNSELGLGQEHVNANNTNYLRTQKDAYLTKPIYQDSFKSMVHEVAQGASSTLLLCKDAKEDAHPVTFVLQMGRIKILKEQFEGEDYNLLA